VTDAIEVVLARIETKLDNVIHSSSDHEMRLRALEAVTPKDQESRLRKLERALWLATGAASVIGGGSGATLAAYLRLGH
jgi:hypothetical protein